MRKRVVDQQTQTTEDLLNDFERRVVSNQSSLERHLVYQMNSTTLQDFRQPNNLLNNNQVSKETITISDVENGASNVQQPIEEDRIVKR